MDSFSVFFPHQLSTNEISPAILATGKVHVESVDSMSVTNGNGCVWISVHKPSELKDNGYENGGMSGLSRKIRSGRQLAF